MTTKGRTKNKPKTKMTSLETSSAILQLSFWRDILLIVGLIRLLCGVFLVSQSVFFLPKCQYNEQFARLPPKKPKEDICHCLAWL